MESASLFLRLPLELRFEVYDHFFDGCYIQYPPDPKASSEHKNLLLVNRQIHKEARSGLIRNTQNIKFVFPKTFDLIPFLCTLSKVSIKEIQHVVLFALSRTLWFPPPTYSPELEELFGIPHLLHVVPGLELQTLTLLHTRHDPHGHMFEQFNTKNKGSVKRLLRRLAFCDGWRELRFIGHSHGYHWRTHRLKGWLLSRDGVYSDADVLKWDPLPEDIECRQSMYPVTGECLESFREFGWTMFMKRASDAEVAVPVEGSWNIPVWEDSGFEFTRMVTMVRTLLSDGWTWDEVLKEKLGWDEETQSPFACKWCKPPSCSNALQDAGSDS